jgi:hypothetical protein
MQKGGAADHGSTGSEKRPILHESARKIIFSSSDYFVAVTLHG